MRFHLPTGNLFYSLFFIVLLGPSGSGYAQVYKSYDADGNVVFSDTPSRNSQEVTVSEPNVTDAFEIPPSSSSSSSAGTEPAKKPETETETETQPVAVEVTADTNNDGRISRREKEKFREAQRKLRREQARAEEGLDN